MGEIDEVTIDVDRTAVDNGSYTGFVVVTSNAGKDSVEVNMRVPAHLFEIEVNDTSEQPVEGLTISLWNLLPCAVIQEDVPCTEPGKRFARATRKLDAFDLNLHAARRGTASFEIDLENRSPVDLEIFDLNGDRVDVLADADSDTLPAGQHSYLWFSPLDAPGTAVYEAVLTAYDMDGGVRYQESVYAVVADPDIEQSEVGVTDADGEFYTDDITYFPGLVEDLIVTSYDETCQPTGTFSIEPVVYLYLESADGMDSQSYELTLDGMENVFKFVWNPTAAAMPRGFRGDAASRVRPPAVHTYKDVPVGTIDDDLRGSCPNPFN
jgi:hypothetical protein